MLGWGVACKNLAPPHYLPFDKKFTLCQPEDYGGLNQKCLNPK